MNQYTSLKVSKRVPEQSHLSRYAKPTFKGLALLNCPDGFVEEYLDRMCCTIQHALDSYSRVFAVRVDLLFPSNYYPIEQASFSNEYLQLFIKSLRNQLQKYRVDKERSEQRVHDVSFKYVWGREQADSDKPHFHLLLLFSGHAFRSLGSFSDECESLYNRIGFAWAEALKLYHHEGSKFVHFPVNAQYHLRPDDLAQLSELFRRASYLAKVSTKDFHGGYHVFGSSR